MNIFFVVVVFFLGALFLNSLNAQESNGQSTVILSGVSLELRLQEGGKTQYNELLHEMRKAGLKFDLSIAPLSRIIRDAGDHKGCFFPTSIAGLKYTAPQHKEFSLIESEPVDYISLRVFTRSDEEKVTSVSELSGKKVALWLGYDPDTFLKGVDAIVEETPTEKVRVKMLAAGRIDAVIGFTPDVMLAAERLNLPIPHYDESLALFRDVNASAVCHDTEKNHAFIKRFNDILAHFKESGKLRKILGSHAKIDLD